VRQALTSLLQSVGLRVEAFGSAADFLKKGLADSVAAACLILDIRLPGVSGLDFQAELAKADTHLPIIFISGHGDIPMTVRAMKAGAIEFLTKPFRDQDLLDAVQLAFQRDRDRRVREGAVSQTRARFEALTPREQEVFSLVTTGLMNKQVAGELGVSGNHCQGASRQRYEEDGRPFASRLGARGRCTGCSASKALIAADLSNGASGLPAI
jgi:FixJ family two-component response regulator